ncbi:MAG: GspH/FimT family pseudopilin [Sedimenticolaceae bacterium]
MQGSNSGFTLIELIITLAVAAVVLTLAAPALRDTLIRNRVATEINSLAATLNQGRSEAIKRGRSVTLCSSSNGTSCCSSSNGTSCAKNWQNGWILFEDSNADGTFDSSDETAIKVSSGFTSSDTLAYAASTATSSYVRFKSNGFSKEAGSFKLCESGSAVKYARALYISTTGRIRLSSDSDNDGVHDDGLASPNELKCS